MSTVPYNLPGFGLQFHRTSSGEVLEVVMDDPLHFISNTTYHLELVQFLTPEDEGFVHRDVMLDRARALDPNRRTSSQHHAEYLLRMQSYIPADWRDYYLLFPGTRQRLRSVSGA